MQVNVYHIKQIQTKFMNGIPFNLTN